MSTSRFRVWLDEEHQILHQRLDGQPSLSEFLQLSVETGECAQRLQEPGNVRLLIEGEGLGQLPRAVRTAIVDTLREPDLKRVAVVTTHRFARIMMRFLVVATGVAKLRSFRDRDEALEWLLS